MISYPLADDPTQMLIAVYDGHGLNGEVISEYAAYALVDALEADPNALINDPSEHLRRSIVSMDDGMRAKRSIPSYDSGSTAIVALLRGRQVWVACVGDSRAIKGTKVAGKSAWRCTDLSVDQKPDDPAERARIEACGGDVSAASAAYGPARVWRGGFGIGPGLAMARSLGDHGVAEVGVTAEPEIVADTLAADDTCLVLASDGVWEFVTSEEALAIVQAKAGDASSAAKALIRESSARWKAMEGNYRDDITAIVCFLPILEGLGPRDSASVAKQTAVFDTEGQETERGAITEQSVGIELAPAPADVLAAAPSAAAAGEENSPAPFIKRRLSMAGNMTNV